MRPTKRPRSPAAGEAATSAPTPGSAPSEPAQGNADTARPAGRLGAASGGLAGGGGAPLVRPVPRRPPDPIHSADLQQAAYIVAREALGRPLTAESKNLLWTANETLKETQATLFCGRGNIATDVRDSNGDSRFRMKAGREMQNLMDDDLTLSPAANRAVLAAVASRARAGNCNEYNDVAAHLHARHLGEGDRILTQSIDGLDHMWARVQSATPVGGAPGSGPAAVLDAWADGPVVEPTDSRHAFGTSDETNDCERIDGADGAATYDAYQSARDGMDDEAAEIWTTADDLRQAQSSPITGGMMDPIPVVSEAFALRARNAIDQGSPTTLRASAVRALLDSHTPPTREQAEANATEVVTLATRLDAPLPWPRSAFLPLRED